jgi:peptide deformylase
MKKLVQASNDPEKILTTPTEPVEVHPGSNEAKEIEFQLRLAIRLNVDKQGNPNLVGLAANQIGIKKAICICQILVDGNNEWVTMVNPEILSTGKEIVSDIEGCGSLREPKEEYYRVARPYEIRLSYHDLKGKLVVVDLDGFSARVVQHEVDHLNGILISDRGSPATL